MINESKKNSKQSTVSVYNPGGVDCSSDNLAQNVLSNIRKNLAARPKKVKNKNFKILLSSKSVFGQVASRFKNPAKGSGIRYGRVFGQSLKLMIKVGLFKISLSLQKMPLNT